MKYIKTFESESRDFRVGDFIMIKSHYVFEEHNNIFKIIKIGGKIEDGSYILPYHCISIMTGEIEYLPKSAILRKLNKDEIEEAEIRINTIKYNL